MQTLPPDEKLMTIDDLASRLGGIGRSTIYRHIKSLPGFPRPVKVGGVTRFRLSEVEAFIVGLSTLETNRGA